MTAIGLHLRCTVHLHLHVPWQIRRCKSDAGRQPGPKLIAYYAYDRLPATAEQAPTAGKGGGEHNTTCTGEGACCTVVERILLFRQELSQNSTGVAWNPQCDTMSLPSVNARWSETGGKVHTHFTSKPLSTASHADISIKRIKLPYCNKQPPREIILRDDVG